MTSHFVQLTALEEAIKVCCLISSSTVDVHSSLVSLMVFCFSFYFFFRCSFVVDKHRRKSATTFGVKHWWTNVEQKKKSSVSHRIISLVSCLICPEEVLLLMNIILNYCTFDDLMWREEKNIKSSQFQRSHQWRHLFFSLLFDLLYANMWIIAIVDQRQSI